MKIAVDFDGTLVEHKYPEIGAKKLFAFETLRELQKRGDQLILWTYRSGRTLDEAVEFCRKNGVEFYAVNRNYPEEEFDESQMSRKIDADIYIEDLSERNIEISKDKLLDNIGNLAGGALAFGNRIYSLPNGVKKHLPLIVAYTIQLMKSYLN